MNENRKDTLIQLMIDQPHTLTSEDIKEITADEEMMQLYEASVLMRSTLVKPIKTDQSKEWRRLVKRILKFDKWSIRNIFRAAAIIIGVIFLEGVTSDSDYDMNL